MRLEFFKAIRIVMLAGGSIYLLVFGLTMAYAANGPGFFTWTADWLGRHGEPYLVLLFGGYLIYECIMSWRSSNGPK